MLFEVTDTVVQNKVDYSLHSFGRSAENLDWFFKVRNYFYSYLDKETLQPIWFKQVILEGNSSLHNTYRFDHPAHLVYSVSESTKENLIYDTLTIEPNTFDPLSLAYYMRSLDFSQFKKNQELHLYTLFYNEIVVLDIRYLGKYTVTTKNGGRYHCLKFSTQLPESPLFKGNEDMHVYVTNDKNHIPVLVDAKLIIGSVKVYLDGYKGLKNPFTSKLSFF